jgi:hypothetical protein
MSDDAWREINPHFRVDHDNDYSFAEVERWIGDVCVSRESYRSDSTCRTWFSNDEILDKLLGYADELHALLRQPCGITVERTLHGSGLVVRIYQRGLRGGHVIYRDPEVGMPYWLHKVLSEYACLSAPSAFAASACEAVTGRPETEDLVAYAKAAVKVDYTEGDAPASTDHIPALRGLFAFARGNYATVSPEDLQAAVDAGYVHPDVLSCVADQIAYATGTSA